MTGPTSLERQQLRITAPDGETFWHRVRFELVGRIADDVRAAAVLDVGAGAGLLGEWILANRPATGYLYEETSAVLDDELERRFGPGRRNDVDQQIPSSALVAMLDVLEHIEDDLAALRAIANRMEPGTALVATVPALQWAYSSWDAELGHVRRYSRASLSELVTAAGLVVDRVDYLFPELLALLPVRKLRRGRRRGADFPVLGPTATRLGYRVSSATTALRRIWPAGTSLVVVAHRPGRRG